ncbi:MAG TPA: HAMP domain-containing sensor histidine kinase [Thermoleophilaceae bacterium]|jgi:signal transduction histidine kinase
MRRPLEALAALLLAAAVGGLAFGLVYGGHDGLLMGLFLLAVGLPVLAAAQLLARRRRAAGSLARQLTAGVIVAVALVALGVGAVALLMFISGHDAFTMAVLLVFAGGLTTYSIWALSHGVMDDIESVRDGLRAVGDGRRDVRIRTGGADEIAELAAAANRMTAQLAEREAERDAAEQARRGLVAAVSHDLRTPLTSLRLLADAVEDELVDPDTRRRYLEQMSVHIRSLSALIEDLFELSRLEAGDIEWSLQRVRLDELVGETVEAMRAQADAKRVAVQAEVPGDLAPARANPEKLQRVLFNLIQNAIRHTPADGSVTVAAESNGGTVEVEVADTGEGLPPEDRVRAFEPFYRGGAGAARAAGDGTGLGLTICRAIVEAHGGEIWFADSQRGARVRFSLPRAG